MAGLVSAVGLGHLDPAVIQGGLDGVESVDLLVHLVFLAQVVHLVGRGGLAFRVHQVQVEFQVQAVHLDIVVIQGGPDIRDGLGSLVHLDTADILE